MTVLNLLEQLHDGRVDRQDRSVTHVMKGNQATARKRLYYTHWYLTSHKAPQNEAVISLNPINLSFNVGRRSSEVNPTILRVVLNVSIAGKSDYRRARVVGVSSIA